ncbi:TPA: colanic acid biosynthesis acetyltransferase WcaF, partial [Salmonella enterica]|nr:colanic acid biosynthesis acetyltransferase WcaF [Salmonella enterica]
MQDLSGFTVPKGFRGANALKVQLWWAVQATLFAGSPQILYRWRAFLLRLFGAKIGKNVVIRPSVKITYPWKLTVGDYAWIGDDAVLYTLGEINIGAHAVISQKGYLCTGSHDYTSA